MYTQQQHELLTHIVQHIVTVQHTEADLIQMAIDSITEQYRALPIEDLVAIAKDMELDI